MMRSICLVAAALALLASPAAAQIIPGTRPPESAAEAIDDAQALLCTLAAAGRPMPGLNMELLGGEGMTQLDKVPDALARFVTGTPQQHIVQLQAPGEPIWVVHDPQTGICSIYSFTDAAPVEAKLLASFARSKSWKRKEVVAPVDHAFEWKIGGEVLLRTEITLPDAAGEPLVVVVRPAQR
jgi:hypothetical protein